MTASVHLSSFTSLLHLCNILQSDPVLLTVYLCDSLIIAIHETSSSTLSLLVEMNQLIQNLSTAHLSSHKQSLSRSADSSNTLEEMIRLLLDDVLFVMLRITRV